MIDKEILKKHVVEKLENEQEVTREKVRECIEQEMFNEKATQYLSFVEKEEIKNELFHSIFGLDILEELLEDDDVSEIMINGYRDIFIEKNGEIRKWDKGFADREKLLGIIQRIVSDINRRVNEKSPIVDARLKDGSRVNVVLNPIAVNGPVVTIRKFSKEIADMDSLIFLNTLDNDLACILKKLVASGYNIFISGGTSSGKTTFLNVLSGFIGREERVITIEDSVELRINNIENLVSMEVRTGSEMGEGKVEIRDLIKTSLRMRPDRVIVGEVRGAECIDMLQAMNTGHDGSMSTGHGNSPKDMILRLETMVLMGMDIPISAIRHQIASGIDIIIHLGRLRDRSRKVLWVCEIDGIVGGEIRLNTLYKFEERGEDESGKVLGEFVKCGELKHRGKLQRAGYR